MHWSVPPHHTLPPCAPDIQRRCIGMILACARVASGATRARPRGVRTDPVIVSMRDHNGQKANDSVLQTLLNETQHPTG